MGGVALGGEALGLARLLEHAPAFGQGGLGLGPALAGAGQRVAVALELGEGQLALLDRCAGLGDGVLGDLEAAGVLVALRRQVVERPVELLLGAARSAVRAADATPGAGRASALSSRARSLSSWWRTDAVERKNASVGMPVSSAMTWSARVGSVIDLAVVVELDRALRAGERLLEGAGLPAVLLVLLELDGDHRPGLRRRVPRPERLEVGGGARRRGA